MKYYAIGFGDWVEIRQAAKPPVKSESVVERGTTKERVEVGVHMDQYGYTRPKYKTVTVPVSIKMTTYEGGKVICAVQFNQMYELTRHIVPKDSLKELTDDAAKKVFDWKGVA